MSALVPLVVGIDENGYGPVMGPLVATAVCLEIKEETSLDLEAYKGRSRGLSVDDSKKVFRGGERSKGEATALALLGSAGRHPLDVESLLDGLLVGGLRGLREFCNGKFDVCFGRLSLPVWCSTRDDNLLQLSGAVIRFVKLTLACPRRFNLLLRKFGSKALVDLFLFSELWGALPEGEWEAVCGKVGSMSRYGEALSALGWEVLEVLREGREESAYVVARGGRRLALRFVKDADEKFLPVALASILGKYVRELSMLSICKALGKMLGEEVDLVSGYRDDRTMALVRRVEEALPRLGLPVECLLRAR